MAISITPFGGPVLERALSAAREIMGAIEKLTAEFWPGSPVIPTMSAEPPTARICATPESPPTAIPVWPTMSTISALTERTSGCP